MQAQCDLGSPPSFFLFFFLLVLLPFPFGRLCDDEYTCVCVLASSPGTWSTTGKSPREDGTSGEKRTCWLRSISIVSGFMNRKTYTCPSLLCGSVMPFLLLVVPYVPILSLSLDDAMRYTMYALSYSSSISRCGVRNTIPLGVCSPFFRTWAGQTMQGILCSLFLSCFLLIIQVRIT